MSAEASDFPPAGSTRRPPRSSAQAVRRALARPGVILVVVLACQLMVTLDATIVNVALPKMQTGLGFSRANLSWVVNAYTLAFGGLLLLGAKVGDVFGRKRVFLVGVAVFGLASLVGGLAQDQAMLLAARAVQGVGGALATPAALALLMTTFSGQHERTRAIGMYAAVSVAGASVGLLGGGMLVQWASWRWVLFVNVPIAAVLVPVAVVALAEVPRHSGRFDILGALTSTVGITGLVYGFVRVGASDWSDHWAQGAFALGAVLLALYIVTETRVSAPITPLRLFTDRDRNTAYLGRILLTAGQLGMFFFITQFLQDARGYSAVATGAGFLPLTVISFAGSQLTARHLVHLLSGKSLTLIGSTLVTGGMIWLTQLTTGSTYWAVFGPMILIGLGNSIAFVPLTTAALHGVAPHDSGAASGLLNVAQQVGGSLGLAVLVTVFGTATRHAHAPAGPSAANAAAHVFTIGATHAFWVAAAFTAAALLTALALMRRNTPTPRPAPDA